MSATVVCMQPGAGGLGLFAPGKVIWRGSRLPAALYAAGVAGGVAAAVVANGGGVSPASGCEELTGGNGAVGRWRSFGKQSATWWAKAWVKQSVRASSCEVEKQVNFRAGLGSKPALRQTAYRSLLLILPPQPPAQECGGWRKDLRMIFDGGSVQMLLAAVNNVFNLFHEDIHGRSDIRASVPRLVCVPTLSCCGRVQANLCGAAEAKTL